MSKINPNVFIILGVIVTVSSAIQDRLHFFIIFGVGFILWGGVGLILNKKEKKSNNNYNNIHQQHPKHKINHQHQNQHNINHNNQQHSSRIQNPQNHNNNNNNMHQQKNPHNINHPTHKRCPNCHRIIPKEYRFCPYCGYGV